MHQTVSVLVWRTEAEAQQSCHSAGRAKKKRSATRHPLALVFLLYAVGLVTRAPVLQGWGSDAARQHQDAQPIVSNCIAVKLVGCLQWSTGSRSLLLRNFVTLKKLLLPTPFFHNTEIVMVSYESVIKKNNVLKMVNHSRHLLDYSKYHLDICRTNALLFLLGTRSQ